jgi:ubiquinone biosynthesis protein Coq4
MKLSLCMLDIWKHILALESNLHIFNEVLKPLVEVNETFKEEHASHSVDLDSLEKKRPKRRLDCKLNIENFNFH